MLNNLLINLPFCCADNLPFNCMEFVTDVSLNRELLLKPAK